MIIILLKCSWNICLLLRYLKGYVSLFGIWFVELKLLFFGNILDGFFIELFF